MTVYFFVAKNIIFVFLISMQIGSITNINYSTGNYAIKNSVNNYPRCNMISFEGIKPNTLKQLSLNPLCKFNEFSIEEYKNLNKYEIKFLRFLYKNFVKVFDKKFYKNAENLHQNAAQSIKKSLDKEFGEGKYVFIPIGRSISSIGKVLSYKIGAKNVKNIPMSSAHRFLHCNLQECLEYNGDYKILNEYIWKNDNVNVFKNFLDKIGLSEKNIDSSNKHYIVCDFCFSGTSLAGVKRLFESDFLFGKRDNIHYVNVADLVSDNVDCCTKLRQDLYESAFKRFSFVSNSHCLSKTAKRIKDTKKESFATRLFWFKLLDDAMTK